MFSNIYLELLISIYLITNVHEFIITCAPTTPSSSSSNNNNNNNTQDDFYSAIIYGMSHMWEFTLGPLSEISARWPPTRRPSCKLDCWVRL